MVWDPHNLTSHTIESRARYMTLHCEVGWAIQPWANGGRTWTWCHQWPAGKGNAKREGCCLNCGKTLKEVRVRINPKTGEPVRKPSRIAREIALMKADVPPVVFIGQR